MYTYIYIYVYNIYTCSHTLYDGPLARRRDAGVDDMIRSTSEISSCFFGPRPWHIQIRHRVKKRPHLICSDLRLSNRKFED